MFTQNIIIFPFLIKGNKFQIFYKSISLLSLSIMLIFSVNDTSLTMIRIQPMFTILDPSNTCTHHLSSSYSYSILLVSAM